MARSRPGRPYAEAGTEAVGGDRDHADVPPKPPAEPMLLLLLLKPTVAPAADVVVVAAADRPWFGLWTCMKQ